MNVTPAVSVGFYDAGLTELLQVCRDGRHRDPELAGQFGRGRPLLAESLEHGEPRSRS